MIHRKPSLLPIPKQEGIYTANATGPDSFTLHGQTYTGKPSLAGGIIAEGEKVYVAFRDNNKRGAVILARAAKRHWHTNSPWDSSLQLSLWPDSNGNVYANRGPVDTCAPPVWGSGSTIGTLPRYYHSSALQTTVAEGETAPDLLTLLSYEGLTLIDSHPDTELPRVAALVTLYDGTGGSIVGYLVREWEDQEGGWTQTGEWIHVTADPIGSLPTNNTQRRSGYLFYDKASDTYTVAGHDGLILCTRANEPTPTLGSWTYTYGDLPGNSGVGVAGKYAIAGAHPENGKINCYYRDNDNEQWHHTAEIDLAAQLSDCTYVEAMGAWDPYDSGAAGEENCHNSRWAWMGNEWYVWVSGRAGDSGRSDAPGPVGEPTVCKAKLLAIRAATGAVRLVEEYSAPLHLQHPTDSLLADIEEQFTYQGEIHPENWVPGSFPVDWVDSGGANGWDTGEILGAFDAGIPTEDIEDVPSGYTASYAQKVIRYSGMTTDRDPTVAPDSQMLETQSDLSFPRGVVDSANSRFYVLAKHWAWNASEEGTPGPINYEADFDYFGVYVDAVIPGNTDMTRIFALETWAEASAAYNSVEPTARLILRQYSSSALLDTLDLTREFSEVDGDITRTYFQAPTVWEYGVAGDYIWLLAHDWWAFDERKITMIVVDKSTLTEVDRIDLAPGTGRLLIESAGRPQLFVGVDGDGPWAHVYARWTGTFSEWICQELRVVDGELVLEQIANEAFSSSGRPDALTECANMAISPLRHFWIDAGVNLVLRQD